MRKTVNRIQKYDRVISHSKINLKDYILIDADGIHISDEGGRNYYRGYAVARVHMARVYFENARNFWRTQTLNGRPLELQSVRVVTAGNSVIPYNSPVQRQTVPVSALENWKNRVAWYNVSFDVGETGWICNKLYQSFPDAVANVANDTLLALYSDKKIVACLNQVIAARTKVK